MLDFVEMRLIPMRLWAMAILSGMLQVLSFPIAGPIPVLRTAFCWIALTPLLASLLGRDAKGRPLSPIQGAALGYCCGFFWYLGNCYWVFQTMYLYGGIAKPVSAGILLLFCLYLGLYHASFGALVVAFRRGRGMRIALMLSPIAWVAVELARARITGFPWDLLGITQVDNPILTMLAPFTGAYGISFVIAAINAAWLIGIREKRRRIACAPIAVASMVVVILTVWSEIYSHKPVSQGTSAIATLVQDNLGVGAAAAAAGPPLTKGQMLQRFTELSLYPQSSSICYGIPELASTNCVRIVTPQQGEMDGARTIAATNLVVWPEAPTDFFQIEQPFQTAMSNIARATHAPVIASSLGMDPGSEQDRKLYNSAAFITADGSFVGRYDKMHLVPFGEYTPYKQLFFFAGNLLQNVGLLEPGTHRSVFKTGGHTYGTFICYESIFGDEVRQFENLGADVLVNTSDDGWYGDTSAAWEHLNMVRMRAIENHRWILRATNTGVTASINPYGRVAISLPRHERSSLRVGFDFENDITFYAAHGDLFAYLCAFLTCLALGWMRLRKTDRVQCGIW